MLGQHHLEVGLGDHVGELVIAVHLGRAARVEVAETGGDDDSATLERLGLAIAAQGKRERAGLPHHPRHLGTEADVGPGREVTRSIIWRI